MPINFPDSPSASDTFLLNGVLYVWLGDRWSASVAPGPTGPQPDLGVVSVDVLPSSDLAFDLGASDLRWRDLYLSGSSIFLGDAVLSSSDGGLSVSSSGGASVAFLTASDAVDFANAVHTHLSSDVTNFVEATQGVVTKAYVDGLSIDATTLNGTDVSAFATAAQGSLADTAVQPSDNIVVGDGGNIGSASDPDAITIASNGEATFSQKTSFNSSGGAVSLGPGNTNHAYIQFYADSSNPTTRSAYLGFPSNGNTTFTLGNELGNTFAITNGNLKLSSGYGIDFSAYGAGVGSNLLDDYEEGSWTPVGNGVTLTVTAATYRKVGSIVHIQAYVKFPVTASTSPANIEGLPFTGLGGNNWTALAKWEGSGNNYQVLLQAAVPQIQIRSSAGGQIQNQQMSDTEFIFGGTYLTTQ